MGNFRKDYAARIKTYRKDKGLTQEELASIIGVSAKTIGRYEQGLTEPSADTLFSLTDALEIEISDLLDEEAIEREWEHFNFDEAQEDYFDAMQIESGYLLLEEITNELFHSFAKLNLEGKEEAVRYIKNLTRFKKYTSKPVPDPRLF